MTIYIVLYSALILLCLFDNRKHSLDDKKKILLLVVITLTIFRGLRWQTGTDWDQYQQVFEMSNWGNIFSLTRGTGESMEFGYVFLNVLVKTFGGNYTIFLILTNFFVLFTYFQFSVKMSKYPIWTFTSILLSINFFPVRQDLAVAVLYYALLAILNRENRKALIFIFIASTIHNISICFLLVFLFNRFEFTYSKVAWYLILCLLVSFVVTAIVVYLLPILMIVLPPGISTKINAYLTLGSDVEDGVQKKSIVSFLMIFAFMYSGLAYYRLRRKLLPTSEKRKELIMVNMMIVSYLIQVVVSGPLYYFARVSQFFMIPNSLLLVNATVFLLQNYRLRFVKRISPFYLLLMLFAFRFYRLLQVFPEVHFPYRSVLDF